jgi:Ca-activated chloride channel family protein
VETPQRRRNIVLAIIAIIIIVILLLLLMRGCPPQRQESESATPRQEPSTAPTSSTQGAGGAASDDEPAEVLGEATLEAPQRVAAGSKFAVAWTGPDNKGDFLTIVRPEANPRDYASYAETKDGRELSITAPIEPGAYELRYVTQRSRTILARRPIEVEPAEAAVSSAEEVVLGKQFPVEWTGPDNVGDFITIVEAGAADDAYGSYVNTEKGSPVTLTAPTVAGEHELRYVAGQGRKVLARRPIRIVMAQASLEAPAEAIAGSSIDVSWTGPDNAGDYITLVAPDVPEGEYRNYTNTSNGSPLKLLVPIMEGAAELRYQTGQGNRVLARRAITIVAAKVTLSAPAEGAAGTEVAIEWTGPNNPGDYITIVPRGTPDNEYRAYANTSAGSPLKVKLPDAAGDAEIRYVAGQGDKVLARIAIRVAQ